MRKIFLCWLLVFLFVPVASAKTVVSLASDVWAPVSVPRAQCFPVERLSPGLRQRAEALLLEAMDGEALYTIVGGIKPMGSGWLSTTFDGSAASVKNVEELRQIVACLSSGEEISAHLHHFARVHDGKVSVEGVMFGRGALTQMIGGQQQFWNQWAITPRTEPPEILLAVEYAPPAQRFRGYGYLFGYPQHAVDFFVSAAQQQEEDSQKKLVPRDFLSIPTFRGPTNHFVYAVPRGHTPNAADQALQERCAPILAEYRRRRALYVSEKNNGIVRLLRDWFDDGQGRCSPRFALRKYLQTTNLPTP